MDELSQIVQTLQHQGATVHQQIDTLRGHGLVVSSYRPFPNVCAVRWGYSWHGQRATRGYLSADEALTAALSAKFDPAYPMLNQEAIDRGFVGVRR